MNFGEVALLEIALPGFYASRDGSRSRDRDHHHPKSRASHSCSRAYSHHMRNRPLTYGTTRRRGDNSLQDRHPDRLGLTMEFAVAVVLILLGVGAAAKILWHLGWRVFGNSHYPTPS
jgi:hypothetical protein